MKKDTSKVLNRDLYGSWVEREGEHIPIIDNKTGLTYSGQIRIKAVRCGKPNCTKCPHHQYAYAQYRDGKKVKTKYLGVAR